MHDKKADEKYCHECGAIIRAKAEICPKCGVRQHDVLPSQTQNYVAPPLERSRLAAALLAIFLGIIGAHKFYLGRISAGILYILFCWTIIPAILGLIEGICYLAMSEAEFQNRYDPRSSGRAVYRSTSPSFEFRNKISPAMQEKLIKVGTWIAWLIFIVLLGNPIFRIIIALIENLPASNKQSLFYPENLRTLYTLYIVIPEYVALLIAICPATRPLVRKLTGLTIGFGTRLMIFLFGVFVTLVFVALRSH